MEENRSCLIKKIANILDRGKEPGIAGVLNSEETAPLLAEIAAEMKITPLQAALFVFIFGLSFWNRSNSYNDTTTSLLDALKCDQATYLQYLNDIDILVKAGYVQFNRDDHRLPPYTIPEGIMFSLRKGKTLTPKSIANLNIRDFLNELLEIFTAREREEISYDEMRDRINELVEANKNLDLLKRIKEHYNFIWSIGDLRDLLLYFFAETSSRIGSWSFGHGVIEIEKVDKIFKDPVEGAISNYFATQLQEGENALQKYALVENYYNDGYEEPTAFVLTRKAKKELLPEFRHSFKASGIRLLKTADIKEKEMFYNTKDERAIEKLTRALRPEQFAMVAEKLEAAGLRTGFACLFSGAPGTGKTETVYQIARRTGRDLLRVNISEIKSKWVGESERNIKEVFAKYWDITEETEIAPILFFNEADAVIGKRQEFNDYSRAVDRMENAMQNIILEELENLNGILIATTNLTKNLDKAFERRFLYKIEFGKPEMEARANLWLSMMKGLAEDDARRLAARFEFSGGQIENIVRKRHVHLILEGREPSYDALVEDCEDEILDKNAGRRLGFAA